MKVTEVERKVISETEVIQIIQFSTTNVLCMPQETDDPELKDEVSTKDKIRIGNQRSTTTQRSSTKIIPHTKPHSQCKAVELERYKFHERGNLVFIH